MAVLEDDGEDTREGIVEKHQARKPVPPASVLPISFKLPGSSESDQHCGYKNGRWIGRPEQRQNRTVEPNLAERLLAGLGPVA